ncbi:hypothetical protein BON30_46990 [Cystobacter ferrugineus]|uniref:Uncharacterized protein n=1 Tax=Cystobacter ferrugineus TaxID=83449 RepID=A0A1L9AUT4_9BACT|nr:hypothetical protein BON30_46990 [Cystobacter ferrugineus]
MADALSVVCWPTTRLESEDVNVDTTGGLLMLKSMSSTAPPTPAETRTWRVTEEVAPLESLTDSFRTTGPVVEGAVQVVLSAEGAAKLPACAVHVEDRVSPGLAS